MLLQMPEENQETVVTPVGETEAVDASPTETEEYARVLFKDDAPPAPNGQIAKFFNASSPEKQWADAEAFYAFLKENKNPLCLNIGVKLLKALIIVPGLSKIDLIYGLGYGTVDIGKDSPIADKYLCLHGEGSTDLGPPDLRIFPNSLMESVNALTPTDDEVQHALTTKGAAYGVHLIAPRLVANDHKEKLLRIAPIPPYFVYDAFEKPLDAAMIYERLLACAHESNMIAHAKPFLRAALVGPLRTTDAKPCVALVEWTPAAPPVAKRWRQERIKALFPSIFATTKHCMPPTHPPSATTPPNDFFAAFLREFTSVITLTNNMTRTLGDTITGSTFEKNLLKKMCGQLEDADDSVLPAWYGLLFQRNQDKKDKDHIIGELLASKARFEDVKIPIYPELKR